MNCPYCRVSHVAKINNFPIGERGEGYLNGRLFSHNCPECGGLIMHFNNGKNYEPNMNIGNETKRDFSDSELIYPKKRMPPQLSDGLAENYKSDFVEAYDLLDISPKASAALSRRCLQKLLEDKTNVEKGKDLIIPNKSRKDRTTIILNRPN